MNPNATYRVVMSGPLINYLVDNARSNLNDPFSREILQRLAATHSKIIDGVAKPMNVETRKLSVSQKLGFEDVPKTDYKALRLAAYNKWLITPERCGAEELAYAHTYRYENDMMDQSEQDDYEIKHGLKFDSDSFGV